MGLFDMATGRRYAIRQRMLMPVPTHRPASPEFRRGFLKLAAASAVLGLLTCVGLAGTVSPPYQIGTWQGFRQAAITYTFDDDLPNQYAIAVPMFNAKGFKMTLFTVTTWLPGGDWSPVQTAASYGHEIASHTVTHPDLSTSSAAVVTNELQNSQSRACGSTPCRRAPWTRTRSSTFPTASSSWRSRRGERPRGA